MQENINSKNIPSEFQELIPSATNESVLRFIESDEKRKKILELLKDEPELLQHYVEDLTEQLRSKQEKEFLMKDGITKLYRRELYFRYIENKIENLSDEELKDVEGTNLFVTAIDLAYLSYFNQPSVGGHDTGDAVIKEVGSHIRAQADNEYASGFRFGGDEFTIVSNLNKAETLLNIRKLKDDLSKVDLTQYNVPAGIPIRIDVATAHISEGYNAYIELCNEEKNPQFASSENCDLSKKANIIAELTQAIADRRSFEKKVYQSIMQLLPLYQGKSDGVEADAQRFDNLFPFMKKGAGLVNPEDLNKFVGLVDEQLQTAIKDHAKSVLELVDTENMNRINERNKVIEKFAEQGFLREQE